jgi:hypothetical protein
MSEVVDKDPVGSINRILPQFCHAGWATTDLSVLCSYITFPILLDLDGLRRQPYRGGSTKAAL